MESRSVEKLIEDLKSLQAQYNNVMDQLGQVTIAKVKLEGAMEIVQSLIKKTKEETIEVETQN